MKYRVKTSCLVNLDYGETIEPDDHGRGTFVGMDNHAIYDKGVVERNPDWFEPIEDEWEVQKLRKNEYGLVHPDSIVEAVGGRELSKKEAEAIAKALNDLEN